MPRFSIISMLLFRGLIAMVAIAVLAFAAPSSAITHRETPSIASLDYRSTETLLSLGIVPTAVIDSSTPYFTLRGAVEAINLGTIIQPNLELLDRISPELVLTSPEFKHMTTRLSGIATVKSLTLYSPELEENSWQRMTSYTKEVGEAVGAADLAEDAIQDAEEHFQSLRNRIADDQIPPLLIVRLMDHKHARVFGSNSLFQSSLDKLGLSNAWQGSENHYGITTVSIDSLIDVNARLVILESPYAANPNREQFYVSGIWQHLPIIQRGDAIILPATFNHFGVLPSARHFADVLIEAIEKNRAT